MPASEPVELTRAALLSILRDARFSQGIACPRCHGRRVHRWGGFADRQRYRCQMCRRTFSDLTGTPAAYIKKLLAWPGYAWCLAEGLSLRRCARLLNIHVATAHRWRHRFLAELRDRDLDTLSGCIEIDSIGFAHSFKGQRRLLDRPARRRGIRQRLLHEGLHANVLLACDRRDNVVTVLTDEVRTPTIRADSIRRALAARIDGVPIVIAAQLHRYGPASAFAVRAGGFFRNARPGIPLSDDATRPRSLIHVRTVRAYRDRLRWWIQRFRGVATHYLPNYLIWHRRVDAHWRRRPDRTVLRWPLPDLIL